MKIGTYLLKCFFLIPLIILLISSCTNDEEIPTKVITIDHLSGYVQKGPFVNGTTLNLFELNESYSQTGRAFNTQVLGNDGSFDLSNLTVGFKAFEVQAQGFYFNEVLNENSQAQLTLYAITDLSNSNALNINVLTTIERERVKNLLKSGVSFSDAKEIALKEVLSIFSITPEEIGNSETLNIIETGEDNAILLAVSAILQGYLSVADLSGLIADIITDFRDDGILDSQIIGSRLINNARLLKLPDIRSNLESHLDRIGISDGTIPNFEKYVNQFIKRTTFEHTLRITYPDEGSFGINLLHPSFVEGPIGVYSMSAILPTGTSLDVYFAGLRNWNFNPFQQNTGWTFTEYDVETGSRIFSSAITGELDFKLSLSMGGGSENDPISNVIQIKGYENGKSEPSWSKTIINTSFDSQAAFPLGTFDGLNLLNNHPNSYHFSQTSVRMASIAAILAPGIDVSVKISGPYWSLLSPLPDGNGWNISELNTTDNSRIFYASDSKEASMGLLLMKPEESSSEIVVEIYNDLGRTKLVRINRIALYRN